MWLKEKLLIMSNFFICLNSFKLSATDASICVCKWERVQCLLTSDKEKTKMLASKKNNGGLTFLTYKCFLSPIQQTTLAKHFDFATKFQLYSIPVPSSFFTVICCKFDLFGKGLTYILVLQILQTFLRFQQLVHNIFKINARHSMAARLSVFIG